MDTGGFPYVLVVRVTEGKSSPQVPLPYHRKSRNCKVVILVAECDGQQRLLRLDNLYQALDAHRPQFLQYLFTSNFTLY